MISCFLHTQWCLEVIQRKNNERAKALWVSSNPVIQVQGSKAVDQLIKIGQIRKKNHFQSLAVQLR